MYEISLLLESKDVPAANGATFDRLNPVTGEVATRAAAAQSRMPGARPTPPRRPSRHGPQPARAPGAPPAEGRGSPGSRRHRSSSN